MTLVNLGRYRVAEEIGRGGMSVVYKATDPALDRTVAIKVLHPHLADRADSRERFTREARAVARLHHANIVEVFDYAPPESARAYIVTEFIDGPTLRVFVEQHAIRHSEVAALLMVPVLDALAHAHAAGIIHRDVKPENIMLRANGEPVLMDFGIAQMVEMDTLTATGTMLGSPAHMAPEVVDGDEVGTQADVFSAGTVLYWLVCGALPFSGPNPAALFRRILECKFDPVLQRRPQAGRGFARLIDRCLARDPKQRPDGADQVAAELREMLGYGGLTDIEGELSAFFADPEVYQDELGQRLVPRYIAAARAAYEAGSTARALDDLDRALAIDDEHPEALALLARIEQGQRRGSVARGVGFFAAAAAVVALLLTLWPSTPPRIDPADAAAAPVAVTQPVDAARSVVVVVDAEVEDGAPAPADGGPPDAVVIDAARRIAARRPRVAPVRKAPDAAIAAPPQPEIRVSVKSGRFKGATVFLDGKRVANIVDVENSGGLLVAPGPHVVRLISEGCKPVERRFVARVDGPLRPIVFDKCQYEDAFLILIADSTTEVRDDKGTIIGKTNRHLKIPMSQATASVALTIGDPADRVETQNFVVTAGETVKTRVNF